MKAITLGFVIATAGCEVPARKPPAPTVADDLIEIPAGSFIGRGLNCREGVIDSPPPPHEKQIEFFKVAQTIDAFSIDRSETSCDDYNRCVDAGKCRELRGSCMHDKIAGPLEDATTYCQWRGMRVPKLAELQRALRSTDGRLFQTGETWDPTVCKSGEEGCRLTSPDGLSYVMGVHSEWTSDTDCMALKEGGLVRAPVRLRRSPLLASISVYQGGVEFFRCSK